MKVTVVIPAFNAARFIGEAIDSVLSQTYAHWELVVVDNGSNDGTLAVALSYADPRLKVLTGENAGVSKARNRGAAAGDGGAIAFLDADDRWDATKLAAQVKVLETHPDTVAVGTRMRYINSKGHVIGRTGQNPDRPDRVTIAQGRLMPFPVSSLLVRAEHFRILNGFDDSLASIAEDLDFIARLAEIGEIRSIPEVLGAYRVHTSAASARRLASQQMNAGARFVRQRLLARHEGQELTWSQFESTYRPSLRQRYGDWTRRHYRAAGLSFADGRWLAAVYHASVATAFAPKYTLQRAFAQRYTK